MEEVEEGADPFSLDAIRYSIVGANTSRLYIGDIIQLLVWMKDVHLDWVTQYGQVSIEAINAPRLGEHSLVAKCHIRAAFIHLFRDCPSHPIVHLDMITPIKFMEYIRSAHSCHTSGQLSKSAFGNKRSALNHLFRFHNQVGYSPDFRAELKNLFKGFNRILAQHREVEQPQNGEQQAGSFRKREGKEVMSVELYKSLCSWFLSWGTIDGVFAYTYTVLSWNLACRSNNTSTIRFQDIRWANNFDSFEIFLHMPRMTKRERTTRNHVIFMLTP